MRMPKMNFSLPTASSVGMILFRFLQRSTIHGLNHVAHARNLRRRILWVTISILAACGFFVNLYYLIDKYLERPVLTNVLHDVKSFEFPDITLCNINPLHIPPKTSAAFAILNETLRDIERLRSAENASRKLAVSDYLYMSRNTDAYSHPPWRMINFCRYMGSLCLPSHFDKVRVWPYGNCYTLNTTRTMRGRRVLDNMRFNGFRPDFRVVVYKGVDPHSALATEVHNTYAMPAGVLLMIHEPNTYPHISESYIIDGYTQVDLRIVKKKHLRELRNCKQHLTTYHYNDVQTNQSHSYVGGRSDCLHVMTQHAIAKACGCMWETMPLPTALYKLPYCRSPKDSIPNMKECLKVAITDIKSPKLQDCFVDQCEHTSYSTVISHSSFPAVNERLTHLEWMKSLLRMYKLEKWYYQNKSDILDKGINGRNSTNRTQLEYFFETFRNKQVQNLNVKFIEQNFMMLRIVPGSLFSDLVEETAEYPLSRLLSDIGGCAGLWVGASLITVFEFLDLILDCTGPDVIGRRKVHNDKKNTNVNGIAGHSEQTIDDTLEESPDPSQLIKNHRGFDCNFSDTITTV